MRHSLSIPKAKQAASTMFGLACRAFGLLAVVYRAAVLTIAGCVAAHMIAGPAGILVAALAIVLASRIYPPSQERSVATGFAILAAAWAIGDPGLMAAATVLP